MKNDEKLHKRKPNKIGILKHFYSNPYSSPAIKRYAKNIKHNPDFKIPYPNAVALCEKLDIPLEEIIIEDS